MRGRCQFGNLMLETITVRQGGRHCRIAKCRARVPPGKWQWFAFCQGAQSCFDGIAADKAMAVHAELDQVRAIVAPDQKTLPFLLRLGHNNGVHAGWKAWQWARPHMKQQISAVRLWTCHVQCGLSSFGQVISYSVIRLVCSLSKPCHFAMIRT